MRALLLVALLACVAYADDAIDDALHGYLQSAEPDVLVAAKDDPVAEAINERAIKDQLDHVPVTEDVYKPPPPREPWLFISLGAWVSRLRGPITINDVEIDVADVLGLDQRAVTFVPRIWMVAGRWEFTLEGYAFRWTGNRSISREIDLPDGTTLPIGASVDTKLNLSLTRISIGVNVWRSEPFNVIFGLGLGFYRVTGAVRGSTVNLGEIGSVDWDQWIPVPVLSGGIRGFVGEFFYEFEVLGIGFSTEEIGAEAVDGRVNLGWVVSKHTAVRVGYRFSWVRVRINPITIEFSLLDGFFFDVVFFW
ncbi:MAG: hypothetical protein ACYTGN_11855 [Planctomycetota bacterium]|jgi:hypothetical protein